MSGDIQQWFNSLPFFTRYWFGLSVFFSLAGRFGVIPAHWVVLAWEPVVNDFHLWRPFTAAFFYPTNFHFLIMLYFMYSYSIQLETGIFAGRPADYGFMLFFCWFCVAVTGLMMGFPLLMGPLVMCVVYMWCMLNKDVIVNFWFGTQFKAMYLPWILFGFNLIIHQAGTSELIGILVGHLYFFLTFKYPQDFGGPSLLTTPQIFYKWFPSASNTGYGQAPASAAADRPRAGGHNWGAGNRLGGN